MASPVSSSPAVRLRPRERRVLEAVADALVPPGGHPQPAASDVDTSERAARLVEERVAVPIGWVLRTVIWVFELSTLLTRLRPFTRLPAATRRRVVALAATSPNPLRSGQVDLFKHLLVNAYLAHETVGEQLGYRRGAYLAQCRERAPSFEPERTSRLAPRTWPDIPEQISCDAVVVGSGAGGAPMAATLAAAGLDVVVVEEGAYHPRETFEREPVWQRFADLYRDFGVTGTLGLPPIPVPLGRAVGGTTVVNAGTCFRAPDRVLEAWGRDLSIEDARPEDLAPLFETVEKVQSVGVPPRAALGRNAEVFRAGAAALGCEGEPLCRNEVGCRGCGESVVGCPFDAKQGVHLTWLPRAEADGAQILSRVRVDRVRFDRGGSGHAAAGGAGGGSGRVRGVDATVLDPGRHDVERGSVRIDADVVVVAAGALHTPVLLAASGVPDTSGQRGRNLQIHPAIGIAAEMPTDVLAWQGVLQSWGVEALAREHGIMMEATSAPPQLTGGQMPGSGGVLKELISAAPRMATSGFLIEDSTSGRVRRGPAGRPLATYQLTRHDRERIGLGFAWVAEAFLEAGAARVLVGKPGARWATNANDVRSIRHDGVPPDVLKLSAYHPVGTHRVSGDPSLGPSDPWGAVRGVDGLWVADASMLPGCLGVNPQITIMAFALRAARRILETA